MKAGKLSILVIAAALLVIAGFAEKSDAGVQVGIGINIPVFTFAAPPPLVVIPGTYAYVVPDVDIDILFYQGYWWRPYGGGWYRAGFYNGPWTLVAPARVPRGLLELPPSYRSIPPGHRLMPYGQVKKNWKTWERQKYWERDTWWRGGKHMERGEGKHGEHGRGPEGKGRGRERYYDSSSKGERRLSLALWPLYEKCKMFSFCRPYLW